MAHLTYFDTIEEYNAYINSEDYVSPNISYCADADAVFMKEDFIPSITVEYTISTAGETKLANTTKGVKAMKIDGQLIGENRTTYAFSTAGVHTVEYQFRRQTTLPDDFFSGKYGNQFTAITNVDLSSITYIGDYNFTYCPNIAFGDLEINGSVGNNCFQSSRGLTSVIVNGDIGDYNFSGTSGLTRATINGNIGDGNFGGVSGLTAVTVNGNVGSGNLNNCSNLTTVTINGNLDSGNLSSHNLTDVYIDGNVGNGNFGGVSSITSMTINGTSVGNNNYFDGLDTLHIKGDLGTNNSLYSIKHIIVDGNMGDGNYASSTGIEDVTVGGNIGNGNLGGASTISAITIGGDVGSGNFGGCGNIATLKVGGTVNAGSNFSNGSHVFDLVEVGGDVDSGNNFYCNENLTSRITISGSAKGGGCAFLSGDTLTIKGDCGSHTINYWKNVTIEGDFTGSGTEFIGIQNVRIKGDVTGAGINWKSDPNSILAKQSFIIEGSLINGGSFNNITGPMIQVGGSIGSGCFNTIEVTDVTDYTVHGNVGIGCFINVSGLTDVTVNGNVSDNCFGWYGAYTSSITSLTLTENCTSYGGYSGDTTCALLSLTIQALTPPTLENTLPTTVAIYVPASAVDTYKAASGWSTYASQIQAISS